MDREFEDYCVAYRICEPGFASTLRGFPSQELIVAETVRQLHHRRKPSRFARSPQNPKESTAYNGKSRKPELIEYEQGNREKMGSGFFLVIRQPNSLSLPG